MADSVLAGDKRYDWLVVAEGRRYADSVIERKAREDGFIYFDGKPSPEDDGRVILTFYKAK
ncbi:hypothetical protein [Segniliparus rugosus]|uniref:Uncharacterized protein n=1 Tax=Segniliparus rugosus (strain ATCC BAA-974 / DSM 45345 / CCUG 50838 / CIP 108380 / JCM 13579 / CDC 945) TaxID=679197 RepID=E5XT59_SEGRC|nr:hypothetical protein [Segniliparus rugosus]EFV12470.1 hypothetical protein HMPREF9336_02681 [Segniliparus rugosus ATCC BAA-974]